MSKVTLRVTKIRQRVTQYHEPVAVEICPRCNPEIEGHTDETGAMEVLEIDEDALLKAVLEGKLSVVKSLADPKCHCKDSHNSATKRKS